MLQFIFGRAASGKTSKMFEILQSVVKNGEKAIYIVPEQFSYETEKAILKLLGDKNAAEVSVMSFSRLCDEVERMMGGMCGTAISDAAKLILLSRAMQESASELEFWKKYVKHQGFISAMLDSIEEFKLNFVLPCDLFNAADFTEIPSLSAKLRDTAKIYEMYNALLSERYIDPSDKLTILYDKLLNSDIFKDKIVFIDTFKGFTGQQKKIIDRIFAKAKDVYIAMTNDTNNVKRYNVFENIRLTVQQIKDIANSHSVKIMPDINIETDFFVNKSLLAVEEIFSLGSTQITENDGAVSICSADTVYNEAEFAARTIRKLVREEGYRYRDFVIIARDASMYEEAVSSACRRNKVACFMDKRYMLSEFPTVNCLLTAFNAIKNYGTEHILRFCKSGLNILSANELSKLENYTVLWNINNKQWLQEWDMNPNGMVSGAFENIEDELKEINALRRKAIIPLYNFKNNFYGCAKNRTKAIMDFFADCNAETAFRELAKNLEEDDCLAESDALKQSWDKLIEVLDSLVFCYGETEIDTEEFCNSFKIAVELGNIGVVPQMLDEVTFGSADRIRPSRPKITFILGANQGVFPAVSSSSGLFGIADREQMIKLGLTISDRSISSAIDEEFLVYTNLCCATEKLYICYSSLNCSNEHREVSQFVEDIRNKVPCVIYNETSESFNLPETETSAFSSGCSMLQKNSINAKTLFDAISSEEYKNRIKKVLEAINPREKQISPQTARKILGKNLSISATKLDVFHRCKFRFFCRYIMGAKKIQPADFDVLQRGTLIHYILEQIFLEYSSDISKLDDTQVNMAVDRYITQYLNGIIGFKSIENPHLRFLIDNISRSTKEVCIQLRNEFKQSDFEPKYCEFKFGIDGKPPIEVEFEQGKILLNGAIDRVDTWNGYIRIVDYKSGTRSFKLPDILVGQNLQMLLYLFAIIKGGEFKDLLPAGIFYMPSKRDRNEKGLAMNGLLLGNEDLVRAMEKENMGEFIPCYKLTSKGELHKSYASSFIKETDFEVIFKYIEDLLKSTGNAMLSGNIAVDPVDGLDSAACKYCDFSAVCGFGEKNCPKAEKLANEEVIERILEGGER